jgi:hypothetical protein
MTTSINPIAKIAKDLKVATIYRLQLHVTELRDETHLKGDPRRGRRRSSKSFQLHRPPSNAEVISGLPTKVSTTESQQQK